MVVEMKAKSQVTIPKKVVDELGLQVGDQFEVFAERGVITFVPVVTYPKAELERIKKLAKEAREAHARGELPVFDTAEEMFAWLDSDDDE